MINISIYYFFIWLFILLFNELYKFNNDIKITFFFHRYLIEISLFVTYFGTCSVYAVIVARNFQQVIEHHTGVPQSDRMIIACLLIPLILLSWVPDLKYLAPVSMVANVFMGTGLGITFYYLVMNLHPVDEIPLVAPLSEFPNFFSITIFAMEAIGEHFKYFI